MANHTLTINYELKNFDGCLEKIIKSKFLAHPSFLWSLFLLFASPFNHGPSDQGERRNSILPFVLSTCWHEELSKTLFSLEVNYDIREKLSC